MKILIACEFSGIVREAFRKKGHDAWSCDLLPSEIYGKHYEGDVFNVINNGWDMMIAFPPCTNLASSGARYWKEKQKDGRQKTSVIFFMALVGANIPKIAIENPIGIMSTYYRKPNQIIQPWQYGEPFNKKTCLWLKCLPLLSPTNIVEPTANWTSGSYRNGPRKDGTRIKSNLPSIHRNSKDRSRTFQGIADAMSDQWG